MVASPLDQAVVAAGDDRLGGDTRHLGDVAPPSARVLGHIAVPRVADPAGGAALAETDVGPALGTAVGDGRQGDRKATNRPGVAVDVAFYAETANVPAPPDGLEGTPDIPVKGVAGGDIPGDGVVLPPIDDASPANPRRAMVGRRVRLETRLSVGTDPPGHPDTTVRADPNHHSRPAHNIRNIRSYFLLSSSIRLEIEIEGVKGVVDDRQDGPRLFIAVLARPVATGRDTTRLRPRLSVGLAYDIPAVRPLNTAPDGPPPQEAEVHTGVADRP